MDENKICFIIYNENKIKYSDNIEYIKSLNIPEGMEIECYTVESSSKFAAYNEGMRASDAKFKVYIGFTTYIINKNFIFDILRIFENDKKIAIMGIVGKTYAATGREVVYGKKMIDSISWGIQIKEYEKIENMVVEAEAIDDTLIVTSCDLLWGKEICAGKDDYLFTKNNAKMVVVRQTEPWCFKETV